MIWCTRRQRRQRGHFLVAQALERARMEIKDLQTQQSSLEDIFVNLVSERA